VWRISVGVSLCMSTPEGAVVRMSIQSSVTLTWHSNEGIDRVLGHMFLKLVLEDFLDLVFWQVVFSTRTSTQLLPHVQEELGNRRRSGITNTKCRHYFLDFICST
jgi:hypothetical protein